MIIYDQFDRANEVPLASNGWLSAGAGINNGYYLPISSVNWGFGQTPASNRQHIRAGVLSTVQGETVTHAVTFASSLPGVGVNCTVGVHGWTVGDTIYLTIRNMPKTSGDGLSYNPGYHQPAEVLSSSTIRIIDPTVGSAGYSIASATVQREDATAMLLARLDDSVTVSSFTPTSGYVCALSWLDDSTNKMRIFRIDKSTGQFRLMLESTVTTSLISSQGTTLQVIQDLRMIVEDKERATGVRIRAYLNQSDDENPTMEVIDYGQDVDDQASHEIHTDPGTFGFVFEAIGLAMKAIVVEDYATEEVQKRGDLLTAQDVIDRVLLRVDRSSNTGQNATTMLNIVRSSLHELAADLGYNSFIWRRRERFTFTEDSAGVITLPRDLRLIEKMETTSTPARLVFFEFLGHDAQGRMQIKVPSGNGSTFDVTYYLRVPDLNAATDEIPMHPDWVSALVWTAIKETAIFDGDKDLSAQARLECEAWKNRVRRESNRLQMQSRSKEQLFGPRSRVTSNIVPSDQLYGRWPGN